MTLGTIHTILVCEPQLHGMEHAMVNAAFLRTVQLAYPNASITFLAERTHIERVRQSFDQRSGSEASTISWREIVIPGRRVQPWPRLPGELRWCRELLNQTDASGADLVLLCSMSESGLLVLKTLLRLLRRKSVFLAVLHSNLATLLIPLSRRPWHSMLYLSSILRPPHPANLRYLALGASIHRCLVSHRPDIAGYFSSLDLPYLWPDTAAHDCPLQQQVIRFGYLGSTAKGFEPFVQLAATLQKEVSNTEFALVGSLRQESMRGLESGVAIQDLSNVRLEQQTYDTRAANLTYVVWTANPDHYRLTASASFLDALAYVKPGLYLRNSYIEHYFDRMGDIGYLCADYEEMREVALSIARVFPAERYRQQCENILHGRQLFDPRSVAPELKMIVASLLTY